jgi:hypothetical protein
MKDHVAEILELRPVVVIYICNLRRCDIGHGRSGEVDELIRLMISDIAQDATVPGCIPEPVWPPGAVRLIDLMGSQIHGWLCCKWPRMIC